MLSPYHLEIWQVAVICLGMVPAFFILNYLAVTYMARNRRIREERIERAVAASVAQDMKPGNRFKKKPRRKF